jgi:ferric-dicitrate binding protein FerR (iron transport regulator)
MNEHESNTILDANVEKLLKASASEPSAGFEANLTQAVLAEVRAEQTRSVHRGPARRRWVALGAMLAMAASVVLLVLLTRRPGPTIPAPIASKASEVRPICGLVSLRDGTPARAVGGAETMSSGEWVTTHAGSRAEIVLEDQSRLFVPPRTVLQVDAKPQGQVVVLQEGFVRVEAAKQAAGRSLTIKTGGSQIRVLGTKLDVHLVQKPDGRKQTRVSVTSGRVELASAGRTVVLLPNMEGIADEGYPPISRSLTAEVNELTRMAELNRRLASEARGVAGVPAIIEFNGDASATVWTLLSIANDEKADLTRYALSPSAAVSGVEAFTLDGAVVAVTEQDGRRYLDLSPDPVPSGGHTSVIVRLSGVKGLFEDKGSGAFEFGRPPDAAAGLSLIQLRLPASASIDEISPKPIETREELSRRVFTIATGSQMPRLVD